MCIRQDNLYKYIVGTLIKDSQIDYKAEEVWLPELISYYEYQTDSRRAVYFEKIYGEFSLVRPPEYFFDYCLSYGLSKSESYVIWNLFSIEMKPIIRRYYPFMFLKNSWRKLKKFYVKIAHTIAEMIIRYIKKNMSETDE